MTDTDLWLRLDPMPDFGGHPGIFMEGGELAKNGNTPASLGMLDMSQPVAGDVDQVRVPDLPGIALDVHKGGIVRLVAPKPNPFRRDYPVLAEGSFVDEHPDLWVQSLAHHGQAVLAIGQKPAAFPTIHDWQKTWHVGIVPLVIEPGFTGFFPSKVDDA